MASFNLNRPDVFPEGTSVKAIKRSNYAQSQRPPSADIGVPDDTKVVTNGVAAFTTLADGTDYYATATVNGIYRRIQFSTPPAVPTQTYVGTQDFSGSSVVLPASMKTTVAAALQADVGPINSQTALQNITGLGLAIGASASEIWLVKYWLLVDAANATMDAKFGFSVPAGCTMKWGTLSGLAGWGGLSAGSAVPLLAVEGALGAIGVGTAAGVTGQGFAAVVFGGGTAGTVQIQYAQVTSDVNPLKIDRGSVMEAIKVAS